jgi:hypothetical protein
MAEVHLPLFAFINSSTKSKFLVIKSELGEIFGMSLEGDCQEAEVPPNLELLVTFGMSLEEVFHDTLNVISLQAHT